MDQLALATLQLAIPLICLLVAPALEAHGMLHPIIAKCQIHLRRAVQRRHRAILLPQVVLPANGGMVLPVLVNQTPVPVLPAKLGMAVRASWRVSPPIIYWQAYLLF